MAKKTKNPLWAFFASVKLALFLLILLASTSIIGTVIQQNKSQEHYVKQWGENAAGMIQMLNLNDMYNSAWFLSLLGIFSLNLIICSLERIPNVIRMVRKDNLTTNPERLTKMRFSEKVSLSIVPGMAEQHVADYLISKGWKTERRDKDAGCLLFSQKGGWTRFGVYIVHVSILIILLGAVIGSSTVATKILKNPGFAFKGGINLPETDESSNIYSYSDNSAIPLGFTVRCDFFDIEFYENGMPKDYLSELTVIEDGKEVLQTTIEVNKPLTHRGITFYQSSYNEMPNPIIKLRNMNTGVRYLFPVNLQHLDQTFKWQEDDRQGMVRILSAEDKTTDRGGYTELEIWLMDSKGAPTTFKYRYSSSNVVVERPGTEYEFYVGPHFATGLQVTKDPGVWWVYTGCGLMLFGLMVAFFMSHRKIFAHVYEEEGRAVVVFAGSANKNKVGFEQVFETLIDGFKQSR